MENTANSVTHEAPDDAILVGVRDPLDGVANTVEGHPRATLLDGRSKPLLIGLHQALCLRGYSATKKGLRAVAVVAVQEDSDIDVNDVAILKRPGVGDAMADAFVHRRAHALRKLAVVEGGGVGAGIDNHLMHKDVDLLCGDSRLDELPCLVPYLCSELASGSHLYNLLLIVNLVLVWHVRKHPGVCIWRPRNVLGDRAHGADLSSPERCRRLGSLIHAELQELTKSPAPPADNQWCASASCRGSGSATGLGERVGEQAAPSKAAVPLPERVPPGPRAPGK
mmetsp:Transcript_2653/g.7510  ORF Transcript_2653/g.7510 Transcript_2653/m.7510 type:complete len:281 (+) Transcript_2653:475-1317(+)|eukprot:CAMPEP_0117698620 /NCGR_PEP_ID=MMETSP0804-20121206/29851_1 /TAXON_ID=1074897 /ORGANISM="Tetraselmis astigmatica, Strain CCMP880" /LENGTH=280 /DNA_ID=CAMNT_0005512933 /DNA_START=559 /DNA_END=1401 /DNA_ORIENTATION=-